VLRLSLTSLLTVIGFIGLAGIASGSGPVPPPGLAQAPNCDTATEVGALATIPNDPMFSSQYGPQKISAPLAWDTTQGSAGMIIAIVDTGIDCTHPDVGLKCVPGYDFIHGIPLSGTENSDDFGHGTHVACIAACSTNNSVGVAGLNWNAKVMPVKVCDSGGSCPDAAIVNGNHWAADHGAGVINMSLGGSLPTTMQEGVDYAYNHGVLVISACGNSGSQPCLFPAAFANSMAVSCTDSGDNICYFSSRGLEVDVAAPGYGVLSAVPTGSCGLCDPSGYVQLSGTSMSTPHVTGVASLIRGQHPEYSVDQVWGLIQQSADDKGAAGFDRNYGFGRLNAAKAVTQAAPVGRLAKPAPVPSVNDNFPGIAFSDSQLPYSDARDITDNTMEAGEPTQANCSGYPLMRSDWYSFTNNSGSNLPVQLSSNFGYAAIYNGDVVYSLAPLACTGGGSYSFMAVPGVTYRIQVGSTFSAGNIIFNLSLIPPLTPAPTPTNTPPATATPTPVPTATPTLTPTPIGQTPTPTPTATPVPTPTPCHTNPHGKCVGK